MMIMVSGLWEDSMRNSKLPVHQPVDHRTNFSGYRTETKAAAAQYAPWTARRQIGVLVLLGLTAWAVMLSPILLIT
jgi:hypothetical protein